MPDLEWKIAAAADLLAIVTYIAEDNPDAAQALKDEIEHKVSRLRDFPHLNAIALVEFLEHASWWCARTTS